MMIRVEKKNAIAKRLGSWKNRFFAIDDSKSPITPARTEHLITKAVTAMRIPAKVRVVAIPKGTIRLMRRAISTVILTAEESSIRAKFLPDCSRIIPSWIMVSSRCVSGLSTGIREVSTMRMINSEMPIRISVGVAGDPDAAVRKTCQKY
jgi:choline-glycine betaine transporter